MKDRVMLPILLVGLALAVTGIWWVWTGLDIVVTERGWSAVIAGATMLSAGAIVVSLAAVLARLAAIARALRGEVVLSHTAVVAATAPPAAPSPPMQPLAREQAVREPGRLEHPVRDSAVTANARQAEERQPADGATEATRPDKPRSTRRPRLPERPTLPDETRGSDNTAQPEPASGRAVVGRHVSGDTTYIMFADGSVEAHTPEGTVAFASLDALRTHAEEREAAGQKPPVDDGASREDADGPLRPNR